MRTIQIAFISAALLLVSLSACEQLNVLSNRAANLIDEIADATDKVSVDPAELPAAVTRYVDANFFETYIETALKAPSAGFEVLLGSGDELYFELDGTSLDSLANCDGFRRRRHGHGWQDSTGNPHGGPHHHPYGGNCGGVDSLLDVNALPAAVYAYVDSVYGDSTEIRHAKLDNSGQYIVAIEGHIILVFSASGEFVEAGQLLRHCRGGHGTPVEIADLPSAVTAYITTEYAGAEIKRAMQKDDGKYVVGILYNGERKILIFDASGNFLAVRG